MDRIETKSRSSQVAEASPIILREGPLSRLVFIPMISGVPTLFEQDQLFIGNVLDVVGDDLHK